MLVRERIQSNSSIDSVIHYVRPSFVALKNNIHTDALCKSLVFSL